MSGTPTRWLVIGSLWLTACGAVPIDPAPPPPAVATPPPDWVTKGRSEAYPDAAFLQAVTAAPITDSEAAAREAAEQKARAALVRVFSSRVHSELRVDELVRAVDAVSRTDLTMEETVRVVGEGTLEGARAAAFHVADGFAHCLLILDRAAGASEIGRRVRELDTDAAALLRQANSQAARADSLALLLQAYDKMRAARIQRVTFAVLAGRAMPKAGDVGESVLAALHSSTATLRLAVESGQGQAGRVGASLPEPVVVRLTDGAGVPVAGVDLRFLVEGKARAEVTPAIATTDGDGRARVEVREIQGSGERSNSVACGVDGLFTRTLAGPVARFDYLLPTAATTPLRLAVAVTAHGVAHDPAGVRTGLHDALAGGGYPIVEDGTLAAFLVRVQAKAADDGMRREQVRARAHAVVQIVDLATGAVDEFATDPAEGLGASHPEAAERSLVRLSEILGAAVRARLDRRLGL